MLMFCLLFFFLVYTAKCFTPNCVPENQFRNFGFPVEACSEYFQGKCKSHPKGYFKSLGEAELVKIRETAVIPTCAFFNIENLKCIYGVNSKIKVLATGAFINLPKLEAIHLEFNQIAEVRKDVFKNISTELIDLSWNKIVFIDSSAFKEVSYLKYLNLSRNSLLTLSVNHLARTLRSLNLAYNLLESIALNSESFLNLTSVDISNNAINKVAISYKYPVELLDLTNNRIRNFDYMDIVSVGTFKMGKNLFEDAPQYLENINAQEIDIYPNPWKCDKLFELWETLVSFNIRLTPKEQGKSSPAECFNGQNRLVTSTRSRNTCLEDSECPTYLACRANKCWDPCDASFCHTSSSCETYDHVFNCSCSNGLLANPLDIHAECKKIDCFEDSQCSLGSYCWDQKCIKTNNNPGTYSGASAGGGYFGASAGNGFSDGSAGGGYSGASAGNGFSDGSAGGGYSGSSAAGGFSGASAGSGYSGSSAEGGVSGFSAAAYAPASGNIGPPEPSLPWWFEDIPNVIPPESMSRKAEN